MILTHVDHLAIESKNISDSVKWYTTNFKCVIKHQDETWALLKFDNIQIALVTPGEHPPHFAVVDKEVSTVKTKLSKHLPKVKDKVTKIKLDEAVKQIGNLTKGRIIEEKQVLTLMRYYELVKEINNVHKR